MYNPSKSEYCGDYSSLYQFFNSGRWHTITSYVELNDAGQNNGRVVAYMDGIQSLELNGLNLRTNTQVNIDKRLFETFFGDSSADWAPSKDEHSYFDNIIISQSSPLGYVNTDPDNKDILGPHPIVGYDAWQTGVSYSEGSKVFEIDEFGTYHYYQARSGIAPNKNPINNSLPGNYVGIYSPIRLDTGEPRVELKKP